MIAVTVCAHTLHVKWHCRSVCETCVTRGRGGLRDIWWRGLGLWAEAYAGQHHLALGQEVMVTVIIAVY